MFVKPAKWRFFKVHRISEFLGQIMSVLNILQLDGVKKLLDVHVCPFCILRYCNIQDRNYLYSSLFTYDFLVSSKKRKCSSTLLRKLV